MMICSLYRERSSPDGHVAGSQASFTSLLKCHCVNLTTLFNSALVPQFHSPRSAFNIPLPPNVLRNLLVSMFIVYCQSYLLECQLHKGRER